MTEHGKGIGRRQIFPVKEIRQEVTEPVSRQERGKWTLRHLAGLKVIGPPAEKDRNVRAITARIAEAEATAPEAIVREASGVAVSEVAASEEVVADADEWDSFDAKVFPQGDSRRHYRRVGTEPSWCLRLRLLESQ